MARRIVRIANDTSTKLIVVATSVKTEGQSFVKPSAYFRPKAQIISKNPAARRINQFISIKQSGAVPVKK